MASRLTNRARELKGTGINDLNLVCTSFLENECPKWSYRLVHEPAIGKRVELSHKRAECK